MSVALASGMAVGEGAEGDGAEEDAGASVGIGCDAGSLVGVGASSRFLAQAARSRAPRAKASRKNVSEFVFLRVGILRSWTSQNCRSSLHQRITRT
jgi:hypothetical protein